MLERGNDRMESAAQGGHATKLRQRRMKVAIGPMKDVSYRVELVTMFI
jgi:hypothetical protein